MIQTIPDGVDSKFRLVLLIARRAEQLMRGARPKIASDRPMKPTRLAAEEFEEFCATHLAHLDEIAYEFFGTNEARDAVRKKVTALYPAHEIEQFTELFFGRIQKWREQEGKGP